MQFHCNLRTYFTSLVIISILSRAVSETDKSKSDPYLKSAYDLSLMLELHNIFYPSSIDIFSAIWKPLCVYSCLICFLVLAFNR